MVEAKEITFKLEDVLLHEAETLSAMGRGPYSELVLMLSSKLAENETFNVGRDAMQCKAIKFSFPGHRPDPKEIKVLSFSVNAALKRLRLAWSVRWIPTAKAFVCIPKDRSKGAGKLRPARYRSRITPEMEAQLQQMKKDGVRLTEMAANLGLPFGTVNNFFYGNKPSGKYSERLAAAGDFGKKVLELKARGAGATEISRQLGGALHRVKYYYYQRGGK